MDELLLRELTPVVIGVLRASWSGLHDGRGRRAGSTDPGRADLAGPAACGPEGLADHGCLAQVPRRPPLRGLASRPGAAGRGRAAARTDRDRRRHVAALLPVRPSVADPDLRGGPRCRAPSVACAPPGRSPRPTSCRRRPWRSGSAVPNARSVTCASRSQATWATVLTRALPGLQRGLHRRVDLARRGDPAHPAPGGVDDRSTRRPPGCWR